jgi:hypothetical protein
MGVVLNPVLNVDSEAFTKWIVEASNKEKD